MASMLQDLTGRSLNTVFVKSSLVDNVHTQSLELSDQSIRPLLQEFG
jgi:hypothetical protein